MNEVANVAGVGYRKTRNWWIHLLMILWTLACLLPFVLIVMVSVTEETTLKIDGYSFFPRVFSLEAYTYLLAEPTKIVRGYLITVIVSVAGTVGSLWLGSMCGYVLSRKDYPYRKPLNVIILITMLFNAGLVPWYLVFSKVIPLKDTLWALIIPGCLLSGFNIMIMRTFFANSVPPSLIESAYLDGAGDFRIYAQIIIPLSTPVIAAIGFMTVLAYWNNWYNSMVFITNDKLVSLQYLMTRALLDIQNLKAQISQLTPELQQMLQQMPSETVRMAMAVIGVGPMLFVFPFFQKYFIGGLTIGAVKG